MFFWGNDPWFFSGFFHGNVVWGVLTYPSTFCRGLSLIGLGLFLRYLDRHDTRIMVALTTIGATVLLSHPVDALFLFAGMAACAIGRTRGMATLRALGIIGAMGVVALIVSSRGRGSRSASSSSATPTRAIAAR